MLYSDSRFYIILIHGFIVYHYKKKVKFPFIKFPEKERCFFPLAS